LFRIDQERNKYRLHDEYKSRIDIPEDFLSYVLKKVESIQESLGTFNKHLGFFYNRNRLTYDSISITIIVLSSSLSLTEGITLIFSEENRPWQTRFQTEQCISEFRGLQQQLRS